MGLINTALSLQLAYHYDTNYGPHLTAITATARVSR